MGVGDATATKGSGARPDDHLWPESTRKAFDDELRQAEAAQAHLETPASLYIHGNPSAPSPDQYCPDHMGPLTKEEQSMMDGGKCTADMWHATLDGRTAGVSLGQVRRADEELKNLLGPDSHATQDQIGRAIKNLKRTAEAYKNSIEYVPQKWSNSINQQQTQGMIDMEDKTKAAQDAKEAGYVLAAFIPDDYPPNSKSPK